MATYPELVQSIIDWSNRDTNVLTYAQIKTFIDYAADNAYRTLRIAPLEQVATYNALTEADVADLGGLTVPSNLIEFIQLRKRGVTGDYVNDDGSAIFPQDAYSVYNSKTDINSFYEDGYWKYGDDYVYTRERNKLRVFPVQEGDIFELYYYRRLPSVHQLYELTSANAKAGNLIEDTAANASLIADNKKYDSAYPATATELTYTPDATDDVPNPADVTANYYPNYVPHWMRENEKILLFGALAEAFDYLDEADQAQKYHQRFELEVARLNQEDKMRMGSGGNIQIRYTANGLI